MTILEVTNTWIHGNRHLTNQVIAFILLDVHRCGLLFRLTNKRLLTLEGCDTINLFCVFNVHGLNLRKTLKYVLCERALLT